MLQERLFPISKEAGESVPLAVLGLCPVWPSSSCGGQASFVALLELLIAVASLVAELGLQSTGSVAVAHGLRCSAACGIFPGIRRMDQGSNLCLLHRQADSYPLYHQRSPEITFFSRF